MSTKQKKMLVEKKRKNARKSKLPRTVVVYRPRGYELPLPQRYITCLYVEADYKLPTATSGPWVGQVAADAPHLPFRWGGSSSFSSLTFIGPKTEATLEPTGFSTLNAIYANWKCTSSQFKIKVESGSSLNNFTCTVVPTTTPSSGLTMYEARTMPNAKSASFYVSKRNEGCGADGFLTHNWNAVTAGGLTAAEVKGDTFELVSGSSFGVGFGIAYKVFLMTSTLDVTGSYDSLVRIRVRYDVELWNPLGLTTIPQT